MSKSPAQPSLLPSPFPADDPPLFPDEATDDHELPYIEADQDQLLPPPNFNPFFTVIEDATTGEHCHPSVLYIFSDDDQEILAAASMRELGFDDSQDYSQEEREGHVESVTLTSPLPSLRPNVKERYVVVDIGPDGQTITESQSLSREWQITETMVRPAPTWDEESLELGNAGLMLKVSGVELPTNTKQGSSLAKDLLAEAKHDTGDDILGALDVLAGRFDKGVGNIAKMIGIESQAGTEQVQRSRGTSLIGMQEGYKP